MRVTKYLAAGPPVGAVVGVLLLAGCGGAATAARGTGSGTSAVGTSVSGTSTNGTSASGTSMSGMAMGGPTPTAGGNAPATPPPVATAKVTISGFAFSPQTISVRAGTTVTWVNKDGDPHTVTATSGGGLSSPPLQQGDTYHYTFARPGTFDYLCTIHPFMTAKVVVVP